MTARRPAPSPVRSGCDTVAQRALSIRARPRPSSRCRSRRDRAARGMPMVVDLRRATPHAPNTRCFSVPRVRADLRPAAPRHEAERSLEQVRDDHGQRAGRVVAASSRRRASRARRRDLGGARRQIGSRAGCARPETRGCPARPPCREVRSAADPAGAVTEICDSGGLDLVAAQHLHASRYPGSSLRAARSPVAPKRTMTWSPGTGSPIRRRASRDGRRTRCASPTRSCRRTCPARGTRSAR